MLVDIIAHQEFVKDLYEDSKSSLTSHSVGSKICKMQGNQSEHEISCFYLGDSSFHKAHERFKVNLVTATINIVTVPVGVVANLLIVTAIFSCLRLRTPSNLLKAFLALSDLFVSLTVQPGYITYRLLENQLRLVPCFVRIMYHLAFFSCFGVSFMTLSAVSYERFVAVRLQVRYNDFFSSTRVVKYVLIIWTLNILLTALKWTAIESAVENIHLVVWSVCLLVSVATLGHARKKHIYPRRSVLDFKLPCVVHFNI